MKNEQAFGFEELEIWKKSRIFKQQVAELVKGFPADERYRLSDQLLRSSRSTNSLIAEGHGRYTYADQIHFCIQARGSLAESFNHLVDAHDNGYLSEEVLHQYRTQLKEIERMLNGYIHHLRKQKENT